MANRQPKGLKPFNTIITTTICITFVDVVVVLITSFSIKFKNANLNAFISREWNGLECVSCRNFKIPFNYCNKVQSCLFIYAHWLNKHMVDSGPEFIRSWAQRSPMQPGTETKIYWIYSISAIFVVKMKCRAVKINDSPLIIILWKKKSASTFEFCFKTTIDADFEWNAELFIVFQCPRLYILQLSYPGHNTNNNNNN